MIPIVYLFGLSIGINVGISIGEQRVEKFYRSENNKFINSNIKYNKYIIEKNLLEDWKIFEKENSN